MGFESRSVTKPARTIPAPKLNRPATRARPPARATAWAESPAASGTTVTAMSAASDESGPRTRIRLGPKMAYATSGTIVA